MNLLFNGSDAMQHLPATERRLLIRTGHRPGREVTLDVMDRGVGLRPDDMKRLFTPFFMLLAERLGLSWHSISKNISFGRKI